MNEVALTGHEVIQGYLKTLDGSPGVYRMLNAASEVLYVGKARNLKARVSNYARPSGHSGRIARMIFETVSMMFLTTRTETEALLLEQNLIKQLKPRYNVLLRDDKSSRKAQREGIIFRAVRFGGGSEPDIEPVAEGIFVTQLHGCDVRIADPALSAISDQAVCRALHRSD